MFSRLMCLVLFPALIAGYKLQQNEGISARIVGGVPVDIKNVPYQVSLVITKSNGQYLCGGAIISESFIISAGHCFLPSLKDVIIRVNSTSFRKGGSLHQIKILRIHPKYKDNYDSVDYDLAVIELEKPLTFGNGIQPIRLAQSDERLPNHTGLTISGWGRTSERRDESPVLLAVNVSSYANEECGRYDPVRITDRMICGGALGGRSKSCGGDSGGPVTHGEVLYGLVSWGDGCNRKNNPDLFTRIAHPSLRAFIKEITGV